MGTLTLRFILMHSLADISFKDRLKQVLRIVREWRNLMSLKRAGRGHDTGGIDTTEAGELCVRCPACPRPEVNLPQNWHEAGDDIKCVFVSPARIHTLTEIVRFIYTLVLAVDANFRLKRRAVSSAERDPALGNGLGYFVEDSSYAQHVLGHADQEDVSVRAPCSHTSI